jgi:putative transposase
MKEADVSVRRRKKYKATTNSNHRPAVFDNLVQRQFDIPQIDQIYAADVTYI